MCDSKYIELPKLKPQDIIDCRNRLNLSQEGFAELYGIGLAELQGWESGEREIDVSKVKSFSFVPATPA